MKTTKRNTVKVNSKGNYLMTGLNQNEKESLKSKREELKNYLHTSVIDQYIIAMYSEEENEVYFAGGNSYSSDERAIVI